MPADVESRMPIEIRAALPLAENDWRTPMPMAIPIGVTICCQLWMSAGRTMNMLAWMNACVRLSQWRSARRAPRAAPSKNWWKMITTKRAVQDELESAPYRQRRQ